MNRFLALIFTFVLLCAGNAYAEPLLQDEFVDRMMQDKVYEKPESFTNYNFESTDKVEIKLAVVTPIKSENQVYEGETVDFRVISDVHYKGKVIIPRHTIVPAKVSVVIKSGMNGIPASIIFSDFQFENINKHLLSDFYEIKGQDRSLLVFPLKWALTILPPTGSLTNFIKGGHAKLKQDKIVKIYYYPNWGK